MQNPLDLHRDSPMTMLDAIGGDLLAGSGFENEEPDADFWSAESGSGE